MRTRILIDRGVPFEYMFIVFVIILVTMMTYNLLILLKGRGFKTRLKNFIRKIFSPFITFLKFIKRKVKALLKFIWKGIRKIAYTLSFPFVKLFSFIKKLLGPITNKILSPFISLGKKIWRGICKTFKILLYPITAPLNFIKRKKIQKHAQHPIFSEQKDVETPQIQDQDITASDTEPIVSTTQSEVNNEVLKPQKKKFHPLKKLTIFIKINKFYILNLLFLILLSIMGFDLMGSPGIRWYYPKDDQSLRSYEEPIVVEFDRPINEDIIQPYIHPEIKGEWKAESVFEWFPWSKRQLKFYPEESMYNGKVFIYYAGITDVFDISEKWEYGIDALSVPIPKVEGVSPENNSTDFPADGVITLHLDVPADRTSEWTLESNPPVEYSINYDKGSFIEISFDKNLTHNTLYNFAIYKTPVRYNIKTKKIIDRADPELVKKLSITTVKEPLIETFDPTGDEILVDKIIKIVFDTEMDKGSIEESFSITPAITGTISWEGDRTFVFTPDANLTKNTTYTITFPAGLKSLKGGYTEKEITHSFKSIGPVKPRSYSPTGYSASVTSNILVNFNQAVNHASAQSHFSISPNVAGTFSWNGNQMIFNPSSNLSYTTNYTVTISSGIKTINGLDSNATFTHSFKTQVNKFILNVPIYYQQLRFSCNLVAARMALAKKGVYISTMTAYSHIAKDSTPYNEANNTFGNPYVGYTGDIYGVSKGYGTYWGPLSGMISGYRSNSIKTGWNRTAALQEVQNGNPVIIWAHNGYSYAGNNISWTTPGGQSIYAISGMHSYVLVGWEGDITNPSYIYLNDPNRGRWKISTAYFDGLWSYFSRSAVVVY